MRVMIALPADNRELRALVRLAEQNSGWNTVRSVEVDGKPYLSLEVSTSALQRKPRKQKDES